MSQPNGSNNGNSQSSALYHGLEVEVLERMENCSLIRYQETTVIVDTADLVMRKAFKASV